MGIEKVELSRKEFFRVDDYQGGSVFANEEVEDTTAKGRAENQFS